MNNIKIKSKIEILEVYCYKLLKIMLSVIIGLITSKADIGNIFSPFSLSLLSISPFTGLSTISVYTGTFLGFISKDFSLYNFKYICLNTVMIMIIYILGKTNYIKKIYSPALPAIVCAAGGLIFIFINDFEFYNLMLLICESILCGCIAYFCKYFFDAVKRGTKLDTRDMISFNIAIIFFISAINEYYVYGLSLSLIFSVIIIYLSTFYLQRIAAMAVTFCISAIMAVINFEFENYFIILYIPSLISVLITKFNKKYCVTSFYLPYISIMTLNGISVFNINMFFAPLISAVVYYLLPRDKLINFLNKYINVFEPRKTINNNINYNQLTDEFCESTGRFLSNIDELKIAPLIDKTVENKIKKQLFFVGCRDIQINNYYNQSGYQTVSVSFKSAKSISPETVEYNINRFSKKSFTLSEISTDESKTTYKFDITTNYKVECFALYKAKDGESVCGDNVSAFKTQDNKYFMILADGMGSGKDAYCKSNDTVTMLKKTLKSGISPEKALNAVNASLCLSKDEIGFSTVDLCEISLDCGKGEIFKCGAYISLLLRDGKLTVIESGGMPVGLFGKVINNKLVIEFKHDDLFIMLSDGVSNAIEEVQAKLLLNKFSELKNCAKVILDTAYELSTKETDDDMTVFLARISKRYAE